MIAPDDSEALRARLAEAEAQLADAEGKLAQKWLSDAQIDFLIARIEARAAAMTVGEVLGYLKEHAGQVACHFCGTIPAAGEEHWLVCEKHPARARLAEVERDRDAAFKVAFVSFQSIRSVLQRCIHDENAEHADEAVRADEIAREGMLTFRDPARTASRPVVAEPRDDNEVKFHPNVHGLDALTRLQEWMNTGRNVAVMWGGKEALRFDAASYAPPLPRQSVASEDRSKPPNGYEVWKFPEGDDTQEAWLYAIDGQVDPEGEELTREQAIAACWAHRDLVLRSAGAPCTKEPHVDLSDEGIARLEALLASPPPANAKLRALFAKYAAASPDGTALEPGLRSREAACAAVVAEHLPGMREKARELGYALAVHGSLKRDVDIVAIPWTASAVAADALASALYDVVGRTFETGSDPEPGKLRLHGRRCWVLRLFDTYIDLSIMPIVDGTAPERAPNAVVDAMVRLAMMHCNEMQLRTEEYLKRVQEERTDYAPHPSGTEGPVWVDDALTAFDNDVRSGRQWNAAARVCIERIRRARSASAAGTTFGPAASPPDGAAPAHPEFCDDCGATWGYQAKVPADAPTWSCSKCSATFLRSTETEVAALHAMMLRLTEWYAFHGCTAEGGLEAECCCPIHEMWRGVEDLLQRTKASTENAQDGSKT